MGTDQDDNSVDPLRDGAKKWNITGSLKVAAKLRMKKILDKLTAIKGDVGEAKIICSLPVPRYVNTRCCDDIRLTDNIGEDNAMEIHEAVRNNSRACLLPVGNFPWMHHPGIISTILLCKSMKSKGCQPPLWLTAP